MGRGLFCMFSRASARSLHVCALMVVVTFVVCSVVLVDVGGVVFFCRFGRCTWWGDKGQIGSLLALFLSLTRVAGVRFLHHRHHFCFFAFSSVECVFACLSECWKCRKWVSLVLKCKMWDAEDNRKFAQPRGKMMSLSLFQLLLLCDGNCISISSSIWFVFCCLLVFVW